MNSFPSFWTGSRAIADGLPGPCGAGRTDGGSSSGAGGPWAPSLACTAQPGFAPPSPPPPSPCKAAALSGHLTASALTPGWGCVWVPVTIFLSEFTLFLPLSPQARQLNAQRSSGNSFLRGLPASSPFIPNQADVWVWRSHPKPFKGRVGLEDTELDFHSGLLRLTWCPARCFLQRLAASSAKWRHHLLPQGCRRNAMKNACETHQQHLAKPKFSYYYFCYPWEAGLIRGEGRHSWKVPVQEFRLHPEWPGDAEQVSLCVCVIRSLCCVQLFESPWTVARQASLSVEFSRQECWSGLPFPSPGDLPDPGFKPTFPASPALAGRFFNQGSPTSFFNYSWRGELLPRIPFPSETAFHVPLCEPNP